MSPRRREDHTLEIHTLPLFRTDSESTYTQLKMPETPPSHKAPLEPPAQTDLDAEIDACKRCDIMGPGSCPIHGRR